MDDSQPPPGPFGPVHVLEPTSAEHTHTAIMLHGRGSNGPEFAEELAETAAPGQEALTSRFPSWRWVFPSSRELWSTAFEEMLPAWFEAHSLTDPTEREELQMEGIRESVAYIESILREEAERLGSRPGRVIIAGISQGGAVGMWTLLSQQHRIDGPVAAFVGASTWLPFVANIQRFLVQGEDSTANASDAFVKDMLSPAWRMTPADAPADKAFLSIPIFLGHGVDDAFVDVELGRQAKQALANAGFQVEWREYSGAELEGHWLKAPEQIDDMVAFLKKVL